MPNQTDCTESGAWITQNVFASNNCQIKNFSQCYQDIRCELLKMAGGFFEVKFFNNNTFYKISGLGFTIFDCMIVAIFEALCMMF